MFPVVACHVYIGSKYEVHHLVLDEYIMHVVQLGRAHDDIGIVLGAVSLLVRILHIIQGKCYACQEIFHLAVRIGGT